MSSIFLGRAQHPRGGNVNCQSLERVLNLLKKI